MRFFASLFASLFLSMSLAATLSAQAPRPPVKKMASPAPQPSVDFAQCATLRRHGDPEARACYQKLIPSADPAVRAEGYWAIRDYLSANDAFRAAAACVPGRRGVCSRWAAARGRQRVFRCGPQLNYGPDWGTNSLLRIQLIGSRP